jgi:UDP-N-acetylmuramate dehydrogenase
LASSEARLTVREQVPLAPFTTLGVGGPARWFSRAASSEDVRAADRWCRERGVAMTVLGGGSNLVIADEGIDALVLHVDVRGVEFQDGAGATCVRAGAGEVWDVLVADAVSRDLAGVECLSGIPGTVGGTPVQNVGAYGQEVSRTIRDVVAFDRETADLVHLDAAGCGFGYRTSRFKGVDADRFVICEVGYELTRGEPTVTYPDLAAELAHQGLRSPRMRDVRSAVLTVRRRKGMVLDAGDPDTRSVGSFFMNPVVPMGLYRTLATADGPAPGFPLGDDRVKVPAAFLIERAGFAKGCTWGAVGLSTKHPLAIVNRGGATAREIVRVAREIKQRVHAQCGIWLLPEPTFAGFGQDPDLAFLQKAQ